MVPYTGSSTTVRWTSIPRARWTPHTSSLLFCGGELSELAKGGGGGGLTIVIVIFTAKRPSPPSLPSDPQMAVWASTIDKRSLEGGEGEGRGGKMIKHQMKIMDTPLFIFH